MENCGELGPVFRCHFGSSFTVFSRPPATLLFKISRESCLCMLVVLRAGWARSSLGNGCTVRTAKLGCASTAGIGAIQGLSPRKALASVFQVGRRRSGTGNSLFKLPRAMAAKVPSMFHPNLKFSEA